MNEWSPPILFENPAQPKAMMISLRSRIWTSVVHPTPRQMLQRRSCGLFSTAAVPETNADALPMIDIAHPECNVSLNILSKLGRNLHQKQDHPLHIIKSHIETYFQAQDEAFQFFDNLSPIVSTQRCFDDLLTPANHVSRSTNDTYYVDRSTVLRTHTSAHQSMMLEQGHESFLVTGDVYRRDEIDRCHYPVFHQMEGVYLFPESQGLVEIKAIQVRTTNNEDTHVLTYLLTTIMTLGSSRTNPRGSGTTPLRPRRAHALGRGLFSIHRSVEGIGN